jgi:elongation factor G
MTYLPVDSFIIQRLEEGGWRVIQRRADLTDLPIADFVSHREADEWVKWKSGHPKINPYAIADEVSTQPKLIEIAIAPKSKADMERLLTARIKHEAEDPAFEVSIDPESGQVILKGMSELHLEAKLDILRRTYHVDARVGAPQVAFREQITRSAEVEYTYKRQSPVSGRFAAVRLRVEPNEPGQGNQFESKIGEDVLPKRYIGGVEKGVESALSSGVVAGFPVVDVKVELIDGKYHDVDSSVAAFENAARVAFREALQKAKSVLLEPIMKMEVVSPEDCIGYVISDLNLRRGQIQGQVVVSAMVPLMNMFGYVKDLHSMSGGRASFVMRYDHYAPAPPPPDDDSPFRPAIGMRG